MNPTLSPRFYPNSNFNSGWLDTVEISGKKLLYLGLCVLSLFAVIAVLYYSYVSVFGEEGKETLKHSWYAFEKFVLTNGFWLFCSIAVLPAFILPVSPLLILAGKWGGTHSPWLSCLYSVIALAVNLSWTYWFAKKPGNSMIRWLLSRSKHKLPEEQPENLPQWALILRLARAFLSFSPIIFWGF